MSGMSDMLVYVSVINMQKAYFISISNQHFIMEKELMLFFIICKSPTVEDQFCIFTVWLYVDLLTLLFINMCVCVCRRPPGSTLLDRRDTAKL